MDRRLKKIERVLTVQKQMHRLTQWQLAALDRKGRDLAEGEAELLGALNRDDALQGLFIEAMARRLKALAVEAERLSAERATMAERLTEAGLSVKRTERMSARLHRDLQKELDKRGFADLLDLLGRPDKASLP